MGEFEVVASGSKIHLKWSIKLRKRSRTKLLMLPSGNQCTLKIRNKKKISRKKNNKKSNK